MFDALANIGFGLLKFKPTILYNTVIKTWSELFVFIDLSRSKFKFMTVVPTNNLEIINLFNYPVVIKVVVKSVVKSSTSSDPICGLIIG